MMPPLPGCLGTNDPIARDIPAVVDGVESVQVERAGDGGTTSEPFVQGSWMSGGHNAARTKGERRSPAEFNKNMPVRLTTGLETTARKEGRK